MVTGRCIGRTVIKLPHLFSQPIPSGVGARLIVGISANALGKLWLIAIQLLCVPILTAKWGVTLYGVWLMLVTVPSYVALSSAGFGTAAAIEMTTSFAKNDFSGLLRTFHSTWVLTLSILGIVATVAVIIFVFRRAISTLLNLPQLDNSISIAILVFLFYSSVCIISTVISAGYQSSKRYAEGTFLSDLIAPVEACCLIFSTLLGGEILEGASVMALARLIGTILFYIRLLHHEPQMKLGWANASLTELRRLSHPALASLSMTLSSALGIQGVVLAIGFFVSPAATALFATTRLLTRIPLQFVNLTSRATLPEMTIAYATQDKSLTSRLAVVNLSFISLILIPVTLAEIIFGGRLMDFISHGKFHPTFYLLLLLSLTAAAQGCWNTVGQFLFAINKQQKFAYYYLILSALITVSPVLVGRTDVITRTAAIGCSVEFLMIVIVYAVWARESQLKLEDLFQALRDLIKVVCRRLRAAPR